MAFALSDSSRPFAVLSQHDIRDYALAHLGKSFLWVAGDALTIFILIRHDGFTPAMAGWIFLAALIWNAICDVLVGFWADRRATAGRSLAPILCAAVPIMGVAFAASLFLSSQHWGWTMLAALLFRTAFSVFDVPHNAMMARLSTTPALGLKIANWRTVCSGIASVVVGLIAMPLLDRHTDVPPMHFILALALVSGLLMLPFLWIVPRLECLPRCATAICQTDEVGANMGFVRLCIVTALGTVALGALSKALLHLDLSHSQWAASTLLAMMIGRFAAAGISGPLIARFGTVGALRAAYAVATLLVLGLPIAIEADGFVPLIVVVAMGIALGTVTIVSWVLLAAQVRSSDAQMQRGSSRFGIFTMIAKVTTGAGGFLLGILLSESTAPLHADAVMSPSMLWSLCVIAVIGTLFAVIGARSNQAN